MIDLKRSIILIVIFVSLFVLIGCKDREQTKEIVETTEELSEIDIAIETEMESSFRFFFEKANTYKNSKGYGLINDRAPGNPNLASIASVGFGLTAIPIGIEKGWITKAEGEERVLGTLETFENLYHKNGFYFHFLNMNDGTRATGSEISVIDTGIFIAGALFAGEYFGGEIKEKATTLYERINWNWFVDSNRRMYYMGYTPERGFEGHWDFYAEQLILYVLGAGSPNPEYRIDKSVYYKFIRRQASYGDGEKFISSWFGSIFTYQFSHAWVDFRNIVDEKNVNWFENSVHATIANRQYAIDMSNIYKTFGENSWGMTACDGPKGYSGFYGSKPSGYSDDAHKNDGTIPPSGAIGSIVFLEDEVKEAIKYFETIENLKGEYGYKDAYNFEDETPWIARDVIGINKGITLLMLQNYQNEFVWKTFMKNKFVQDGLNNLGFKEVK